MGQTLSEFRRLNCSKCKICIKNKLYSTKETCCPLPYTDTKIGSFICANLLASYNIDKEE